MHRPDLDLVIDACSRQQLPIGRPGQSIDLLVARDEAQELPLRHIPQTQGAFGTPCAARYRPSGDQATLAGTMLPNFMGRTATTCHIWVSHRRTPPLLDEASRRPSGDQATPRYMYEMHHRPLLRHHPSKWQAVYRTAHPTGKWSSSHRRSLETNPATILAQFSTAPASLLPLTFDAGGRKVFLGEITNSPDGTCFAHSPLQQSEGHFSPPGRIEWRNFDDLLPVRMSETPTSDR